MNDPQEVFKSMGSTSAHLELSTAYSDSESAASGNVFNSNGVVVHDGPPSPFPHGISNQTRWVDHLDVVWGNLTNNPIGIQNNPIFPSDD